MTGLVVPRGRRSELPTPPVEIADAVEMYARESDRHARLVFIPTVLLGRTVASGTWCARFTLRNSDTRMKLYNMGLAEKPPTEDVWFHVSNPRSKERGQLDYMPLNIHEMGVGGVLQFLQRGNSWSGRGQYSSLEEQLRLVREGNEQMRLKNRADQKEASRYDQRDKRRSRYGIPFHTVEMDLKEDNYTTAPPTSRAGKKE